MNPLIFYSFSLSKRCSYSYISDSLALRTCNLPQSGQRSGNLSDSKVYLQASQVYFSFISFISFCPPIFLEMQAILHHSYPVKNGCRIHFQQHDALHDTDREVLLLNCCQQRLVPPIFVTRIIIHSLKAVLSLV